MKTAGTVVLIGGGPSLTPEQVEKCRGKATVIAINSAVFLAPWADALYFCDEQWYRWHEQTVKNFKGLKVTLENRKLAAELPGLVCMRQDGGKDGEPGGLCEAKDGLRTGLNSGYQAINLAVHWGARRIVLLGYDMKPALNGRMHWHTEHPVPTPKDAPLAFLPHFDTLLEPLARLGVQVLNATPGSALEAFPKVSLEEALCPA